MKNDDLIKLSGMSVEAAAELIALRAAHGSPHVKAAEGPKSWYDQVGEYLNPKNWSIDAAAKATGADKVLDYAGKRIGDAAQTAGKNKTVEDLKQLWNDNPKLQAALLGSGIGGVIGAGGSLLSGKKKKRPISSALTGALLGGAIGGGGKALYDAVMPTSPTTPTTTAPSTDSTDAQNSQRDAKVDDLLDQSGKALQNADKAPIDAERKEQGQLATRLKREADALYNQGQTTETKDSKGNKNLLEVGRVTHTDPLKVNKKDGTPFLPDELGKLKAKKLAPEEAASFSKLWDTAKKQFSGETQRTNQRTKELFENSQSEKPNPLANPVNQSLQAANLFNSMTPTLPGQSPVGQLTNFMFNYPKAERAFNKTLIEDPTNPGKATLEDSPNNRELNVKGVTPEPELDTTLYENISQSPNHRGALQNVAGVFGAKSLWNAGRGAYLGATRPKLDMSPGVKPEMKPLTFQPIKGDSTLRNLGRRVAGTLWGGARGSTAAIPLVGGRMAGEYDPQLMHTWYTTKDKVDSAIRKGKHAPGQGYAGESAAEAAERQETLEGRMFKYRENMRKPRESIFPNSNKEVGMLDNAKDVKALRRAQQAGVGRNWNMTGWMKGRALRSALPYTLAAGSAYLPKGYSGRSPDSTQLETGWKYMTTNPTGQPQDEPYLNRAGSSLKKLFGQGPVDAGLEKKDPINKFLNMGKATP